MKDLLKMAFLGFMGLSLIACSSDDGSTPSSLSNDKIVGMWDVQETRLSFTNPQTGEVIEDITDLDSLCDPNVTAHFKENGGFEVSDYMLSEDQQGNIICQNTGATINGTWDKLEDGRYILNQENSETVDTLNLQFYQNDMMMKQVLVEEQPDPSTYEIIYERQE